MNALRVAITASLWLYCGALPANAAPTVEALRASLRAVPAPELPITAARMIQESPASDRETTTLNVVAAAVDLNPAAAPLVVGAVARTLPDMAALAAATAASRQLSQIDAITKAAVTVAPGHLGKIVTSLCSAFPNEFRRIAVAAEETVPNARPEIIQSVGSALPELRPYLDRETALYGRTAPPVAIALDHATAAHATATGTNALSNAAFDASPNDASNASAPETPDNLEPKGGGNANGNGNGNGHHGGRNYAKP